jgi:hypothetical protein
MRVRPAGRDHERGGVRMAAGDWIPFGEGRYLAERVFLVGGGGRLGVEIEETVVEVTEDRRGRRLNGRGRVRNDLLVRLLEEPDEPELWLDMGGEFKYRMAAEIQGGKVFTPGLKSFVQFLPLRPWEPVGEADFNSRIAGLRTPGDAGG